MWPCPPPYPSAFLGGPAEKGRKAAERRYMNMAVILLTWLALGSPWRAPEGYGGQTPLRPEQLEMVTRLEALALPWLRQSAVDSDQLGRTEEKERFLVDTLLDMERRAGDLLHEVDPYAGQAVQRRRAGKRVGRDPRTQVVGRLEAGAATVAKPIVAQRLSFFGLPSFDPETWISSDLARAFAAPAGAPVVREGPVPRSSVMATREEFRRLLSLLDGSARLVLIPREEAPRERCGLFAVTKDHAKDRLILDRRCPNWFERRWNRWTQLLGNPAALADASLKDDEVMALYSEDLRDFFYVFRVSRARAVSNAFCGDFSAEEVRSLRAFTSCPRSASGRYVACLGTLAMGDHNAPEIAQAAHLRLASAAGAVESRELISLHEPFPRTRVAAGILFDDFVLLEKEARVDGLPADAPPSSSSAAARLGALRRAYAEVGLTPHEGKAVRRKFRGVAWGLELDGVVGSCRAPRDRVLMLASLTLSAVRLGLASVRMLESLIGSWIAAMAPRRRALCLLDLVFEAVKGRELEDIICLSPALSSELLAVALLAPTLCADWRAAPPRQIDLVDASSRKIAAGHAAMPAPIASELFRRAFRRSRWVKALPPAACWLREHGLLDPSAALPDGLGVPPAEPWVSIVSSMQFSVDVCCRGLREHINLAELRGQALVEARAAMTRPRSQLLVGTDSLVGLAAVAKGRAQSPSLNRALRRMLPNVIGGCLYTRGFYIESGKNPMDDPTRDVAIRGPARESPLWWDAAAAGRLDGLDRAFFEAVPPAPGPDLDELGAIAARAHGWTAPRRLDPAACAHCLPGRIGEAPLPGPLRPAARGHRRLAQSTHWVSSAAAGRISEAPLPGGSQR